MADQEVPVEVDGPTDRLQSGHKKPVAPLFPDGLFEGQGAFEPYPLHALAKHMLDGKWVDVRTDEGLICRVRITEIVVRTQGEDIKLHQEWLEGDDDDVRRIRHEVVVDSDAIWKVLPSNYHIEQVRPWGGSLRAKARSGGGNAPSEDATAQVIATITHAAKFLFDMDDEALFRSNDWNDVNHRHQAIIVTYEMTNLTPNQICETTFRYKSQGPWLTAAGKLVAPKNYGGHPAHFQARVDAHIRFVAGVRNLGQLVDDQLGERYRRDPKTLARDYTPVLA